MTKCGFFGLSIATFASCTLFIRPGRKPNQPATPSVKLTGTVNLED